MKYTIWARVHSKKDSQQMVFNGTRPHILPSKLFQEFRESALWELKMQHPYPVTRPYYIHLTIEMKKGQWADPDNMESAINDVLQDAGIIGNDRWNLHVLRDVIPDRTKWLTTIEIMDQKTWEQMKLKG